MSSKIGKQYPGGKIWNQPPSGQIRNYFIPSFLLLVGKHIIRLVTVEFLQNVGLLFIMHPYKELMITVDLEGH